MATNRIDYLIHKKTKASCSPATYHELSWELVFQWFMLKLWAPDRQHLSALQCIGNGFLQAIYNTLSEMLSGTPNKAKRTWLNHRTLRSRDSGSEELVQSGAASQLPSITRWQCGITRTGLLCSTITSKIFVSGMFGFEYVLSFWVYW